MINNNGVFEEYKNKFSEHILTQELRKFKVMNGCSYGTLTLIHSTTLINNFEVTQNPNWHL